MFTNVLVFDTAEFGLLNQLHIKPNIAKTWDFSTGGEGNPAWSAALAFAVAVLGAILIFMDHQITQVIVNRRENKLEVGGCDQIMLCVTRSSDDTKL